MKAKTNPTRCKSCGLCIAQCPKDAISVTNELNASGYKIVTVDENKCIGCGICYTVCPDGVFAILD